MSEAMARYTIIGNGVAGNTAALTLARAEPGARIDVYTAEPHPYYPRPRLPAFLAGELGLEQLYIEGKKYVGWGKEKLEALLQEALAS